MRCLAVLVLLSGCASVRSKPAEIPGLVVGGAVAGTVAGPVVMSAKVAGEDPKAPDVGGYYITGFAAHVGVALTLGIFCPPALGVYLGASAVMGSAIAIHEGF